MNHYLKPLNTNLELLRDGFLLLKMITKLLRPQKDYLGCQSYFSLADSSPYLADDYLVNLRANSPQQGEDTGDPSMQHDVGLQNRQDNP